MHLFGSVVAVAFQSSFRTEMHQNDVFLLFLRSALQNDLKHIKRSFLAIVFYFLETRVQPRFQMLSKPNQ